jgi:putative peptidoglycan lipid II flippase
MILRRILKIKSLVDFIYLFFSNIIIKIFGFFRELILAYFFGSSLIYAYYILLKTVADFLSQFTFGNALQANLLPKLSKHFNSHKKVSYHHLFQFTKKTLIVLFIISQVVQLIIIVKLQTEYTMQLILLSFLLSLLVIGNFFNSIFFTVLQAEGNFKTYSIANSFNLFVSTILLYPFILVANIFGVVLSRILGVIFLAKRYIQPIILREKGKEIKVDYSDFSFSVLLLGNLSTIIILIARFISGSDGGNNITFFNYAAVILTAFLTSIVANINTLMLRKISIDKNLLWFFYSVILTILICFFLFIISYYYSESLIKFIYQRGEFSISDSISTAYYFKNMTVATIIILISSVLCQPYFTLDKKIRENYASKLTVSIIISFLAIIFITFLNDWEIIYKSLFSLYSMSFIYFIFSIFSVIKYFKHED